MVFDPGLRCGDRTILFCTEDIHSDRLRLRRCGKRSHDSYLFTAVSAGDVYKRQVYRYFGKEEDVKMIPSSQLSRGLGIASLAMLLWLSLIHI